MHGFEIKVRAWGSSFEQVKHAAQRAAERLADADSWRDVVASEGWAEGFQGGPGPSGSLSIECSGPLEAQLEAAKAEVARIEAMIGGAHSEKGKE